MQASEALDAIGDTRADLADRLVTPWFHHPVLAVLMTGMVLVHGLEQLRDSWFRVPFALVVIAASLGLARLYAHMTGISISSPVGPRSKLMLTILGVGLVGSLLWLIIAEPAQGVVLGVAGFVFVFTVVAGRSYDAALRADLRTDLRTDLRADRVAR
ncbi:hypothetical protein ASD30_12250 [Nocardioides sp. Root140]|nr:hypothetical protein ASD30_12250 [Nocardioides sp. Root140]KRF13152.1 hypothetical protein ASH02_16895 [Nocardioides sp. Soil796]